MIITNKTTKQEIYNELKDILDNKWFEEIKDYFIYNINFNGEYDILEPFYSNDSDNPLLNKNIKAKQSIFESLKETWLNHYHLEEIYDIIYQLVQNDISNFLNNIDMLSDDCFQEKLEDMIYLNATDENDTEIDLLHELEFLELIDNNFDIRVPFIDELDILKEKGIIL